MAGFQRVTLSALVLVLSATSMSSNRGVLAQQPTGTLRVCRLMGLFQMERSGDEVGLAVGTTGWNAGGVPLDWHRRPDARHPFIAQALYRLADDRLEQIGIATVSRAKARRAKSFTRTARTPTGPR
jgi:hypothetical protein